MTTHNQHIVLIAGEVFAVVDIENDDVEAYKAANYKMPQVVVIVKHEEGMNLKAAKAKSIKLAKEAGIY